MPRDLRSKNRRTAAPLEIRALSETGMFEGYGSVFGVEDSYGEIVERGAFKASLTEHRAQGTMPAMLWQHDPWEPIGVYTNMVEDEKGLKVEGKLELETQRGREAHALLKSGALTGLSIGFMPKVTRRDEDTGEVYLEQVDLWEVSLVTFPANGDARVSGAKSLGDIREMSSFKEIEAYLGEQGGFSRDAATALVGAVKRICNDEREARAAKAEFKSASDQILALLKT